MIDINKDGFITGWNSPSKRELKELSIIDELKDSHGNYLYKWDGEKPVLFDIILTDKQKDKERSTKIEAEIPYTIQEELALINKGIIDKDDIEYVNYRSIIEGIKTKYPKT